MRKLKMVVTSRYLYTPHGQDPDLHMKLGSIPTDWAIFYEGLYNEETKEIIVSAGSIWIFVGEAGFISEFTGAITHEVLHHLMEDEYITAKQQELALDKLGLVSDGPPKNLPLDWDIREVSP